MDWRWAWVLGFALIAPAALPAGGADRRQPAVRRRLAAEPLLVADSVALRSAPRRHAPALVALQPGEPLRLLRRQQRFPSLEALTAQIGQDADQARREWRHHA
jgi:hypothetical protein